MIGISSDSFLYSCEPMTLILYKATFAITEIDFVPGPFRCQIEQQHLRLRSSTAQFSQRCVLRPPWS